MYMDYGCRITCIDMFINDSEEVISYTGPSDESGTEIDYRWYLKTYIEHMLLKDSVFILTQKDHKKFLTIAIYIYKSTKKTQFCSMPMCRKTRIKLMDG